MFTNKFTALIRERLFAHDFFYPEHFNINTYQKPFEDTNNYYPVMKIEYLLDERYYFEFEFLNDNNINTSYSPGRNLLIVEDYKISSIINLLEILEQWLVFLKDEMNTLPIIGQVIESQKRIKDIEEVVKDSKRVFY